MNISSCETYDKQVWDRYEKDTALIRNVEDASQLEIATDIWGVAYIAVPGTSLLAVTYVDGYLVVFHIETGSRISTLPGAVSQTLCSSLDGRTLASGDSRGHISLFDFQTLKCLHKIELEADALKIRALTFAADNPRLIEIRGLQCHIWEPSVLLRQDADDDSSDRVARHPSGSTTRRAERPISPPQRARSEPLVFCGQEGGAVHLYDMATSRRVSSYLSRRRTARSSCCNTTPRAAD